MHIAGKLYAGNALSAVTDAVQDSRHVKAGNVFFALQPQYITDAVSKGAAAIVSEEEIAESDRAPGVAYYICDDVRLAVAKTASACYADVIEKKIAVTGTNGKTSVAWIARAIWEALDKKAVSVGTLGVVTDGEIRVDVPLTTPDAVSLHKALRKAGENGAVRAVLETSSHGLEQHRVSGLRFDVGMFTNLTQDHLDYHKTFDAYFSAKCKLFDLLKPNAPMIVNADSDYFEKLKDVAAQKNVPIISVGTDERADCRLISMHNDDSGQVMEFSYKGKNYKAHMQLMGEFQCRNALYSICAVHHTDNVNIEDVIAALSRVSDVPGRMQCAGTKNGAAFYVDYAHTPDALINALESLRKMTKNRLIALVGCGGDRDALKRPLMGAAASKLADMVIVTDDNPRTEDPAPIRAAILKGCDPTKSTDGGERRAAIRMAVKEAQPGDCVLIAGKGHEDYQEINGVRSHFSDTEETVAAIKESA